MNMGASKTIHNNQLKIKMQNPSQKPSMSSEAPAEDLKDIDVPCTFKINIKKIRKMGVSNISNHIRIKI